MRGVTGLFIMMILYSGIAVAKNNKQETDPSVARLSYQRTYGFEWTDQQDSPRICFALYRSGQYRILKLKEQGAETLQGTLSHDELASFGNIVKRLDSEHQAGGIIRQGSESFIAEVARGRANVHFLWVDPDHRRAFPDSAAKAINWLQNFQALDGSTINLRELGEEPICPTAAEKSFRPLITSLK